MSPCLTWPCRDQPVSLVPEAPHVRSADEVARSERRLDRLLHNLSVTVTVIDEAGRVKQTTGQGRPILGYAPSWWVGRSLLDVAHPEDVTRGLAVLERSLEHPHREVAAELRVRHADGHHEWLEVTAVNLLDDPDVAGIVVTTRNVTQSKKIEQALSAGREDALRVAQAKSEFVAAVSHELRSPLHAILGLAELLEQEPLDTEPLTWAHGIHREADRLRRVIDDVLDLSRIEAGRMTLVSQPFSLRELAAEVLALFRARAAGKGVRLTLDVGATVTDARVGDPYRLRQVLVNLVGNAVKFTDAGFVELEIGAGEASPDEVDGAAASADEVVFRVRDSGPGIPPDARERLFEAFQQADASNAREGAGLGLAISARLVELMGGGAIGVSSLVGQGSTFTCRVPLATAAAPSGDTGVVADPGVVGGGRVLVVDDNATNRLLVTAQLRLLGHESVVLPDAESGMHAATTEVFDVVLMDLQMPGMDGLDATRRIRALEQGTGRHVPIVALTASALSTDRERCRRAGMDGFLAKPVELRDLEEALAPWTGPAPSAAVVVGGAEPVARPAPASPVQESSLLDAERFARLAEELPAAALDTVIGTYTAELEGRVKAIVAAHTNGQADQLRRAAHGLRSPSAMLAAVALAEECRRIEESADPMPSVDPEGLRLLARRTAAALAAHHPGPGPRVR